MLVTLLIIILLLSEINIFEAPGLQGCINWNNVIHYLFLFFTTEL